MMVLRCGPFEVGHPKRFQKRVFTPLKGTTSIPVLSAWESPSGMIFLLVSIHQLTATSLISVFIFMTVRLAFWESNPPIAHLLSSENMTKLDILVMYNLILSTKMCGD